MPEYVHHIVKRLILYICICLLAGIGISGMTAFFHTSFSSTSSILFPLLTSFLMVFHITIACFMGMKYWSSKRRLYLTPVSFGFACSALMNPLMILVKIIKLRWIHILSYDQMV
ncbi:MASE4 domain-containing protein, partial [Klebsiella pneumoniae]|uniref:MASE4 domain-containing protein n=1 Tax=Klebsiella pneumoniae TaxID=573 RepID=UPI0039B489D4